MSEIEAVIWQGRQKRARIEKDMERIENAIELIESESELIESESELIESESEQLEKESERLDRESARLVAMICCVDQLCYPPASSSTQTPATGSDCGSSLR